MADDPLSGHVNELNDPRVFTIEASLNWKISQAYLFRQCMSYINSTTPYINAIFTKDYVRFARSTESGIITNDIVLHAEAFTTYNLDTPYDCMIVGIAMGRFTTILSSVRKKNYLRIVKYKGSDILGIQVLGSGSSDGSGDNIHKYTPESIKLNYEHRISKEDNLDRIYGKCLFPSLCTVDGHRFCVACNHYCNRASPSEIFLGPNCLQISGNDDDGSNSIFKFGNEQQEENGHGSMSDMFNGTIIPPASAEFYLKKEDEIIMIVAARTLKYLGNFGKLADKGTIRCYLKDNGVMFHSKLGDFGDIYVIVRDEE